MQQGQRRLLAVSAGIVACSTILLLVAGALRRRPPEAAPQDATTPPETHRGRVYREKLESGRYANRDLGFSLAVPPDWTASIGTRSDDTEPYEGLVLKIVSAASGGSLGSLISIVKRSRPAGTGGDPIDYLRKEFLSPEKSVEEQPQVVRIAGQAWARVSYRVGTEERALRAIQCVYVGPVSAIILTGMAPEPAFRSLESAFQAVVDSFEFDS